jgi:hypothetical protein
MAMGLLRPGINEVIATTYYNAAPMGIHQRNGRTSMVVFRQSHTAELIVENGWIVANFIFDPYLYVQTAFTDLPDSEFIEEEVDGTVMHRLDPVEAWAAFSAQVVRETTQRLMVQLTCLKEEVLDVTLHPVNRGFSSIIEATVHATRYVMTGDPALADLIGHHASIVKKCGGKRESEALTLLLDYIDKFGDKGKKEL